SDAEAGQVYCAALHAVTQRLPELRPAVLAAWSARDALYSAIRQRCDPVAPGQQLLRVMQELLCQLVVIEEEPAGTTDISPNQGASKQDEQGAADQVDSRMASLRERVLDVLTPQQGRILDVLWERQTASFDVLATIPGAWRGNEAPSDD